MIRSLRYGSPAFIIPGAQKCGTTALAVYLDRHPRLRLATTKEPDFFLRHARYSRGGAYYRKLFPRKRLPGSELFFEASVGYSFDASVPERMAAFDPELRFVVMVREPATRAHSAWNHYRTLVTAPSERRRLEEWLEDHNAPDRDAGHAMLARPHYPSFDEAIAIELEAIARNGPVWTLPSLVAGGLYATQLGWYLAHFPRDRFLVLEDRELAERPAETLNRVLEFLGVAPHDWGDDFPRVFQGSYEDTADEPTLARLRDFYAEPNGRFFELIGRRFDW